MRCRQIGLPRRELVLSPGHGVLVGDVLIPVGELANGRTIVQLAPSGVNYLHVELDCHDILLAEGLPAESYLDTGIRADFSGGLAALTLHPTFAAMAHEMACRFVAAGPEVAAERARLAERADAMETAGASRRTGPRLWGRRAG